MSNKNDYDHSKKRIHDAVGISDERADELNKLLNELPMGCSSMSEIVEKLEENMSARELAFIVVMSKVEDIKSKGSLAVLGILQKITEKLAEAKKDEEEKYKPPFFMGGGGDA